MIASLSKFDSRRLSLPSQRESKKRSMIKELRVDYRKCFTNSALSSTAKRFSPSTQRTNLMGFVRWRIQFNLGFATWSLDHLIRPIEQRLRNRHADLFGRFQIEYQLKLRRPLHRQIGRFGSLQDSVDVMCHALVIFRLVRGVGHEPTGLYSLSAAV